VVLEGSVRKAGNRLRITLQLIDVTTEAHLWAETYDRTLDDVFVVQSEVARSVASALEVQLVSKALRPAGEPGKANPEAYAAYLKGRGFMSRRSAGNIRNAIECFERAIELDLGHAAVHAALSIAYEVLPNYASVALVDVAPKAKASALEALTLDPNLPEAHVALGGVFSREFDLKGAERELRKAIELSPSYALAHHWLGLYLSTCGRSDEAIAALMTAQTLDPLSAVQHGALGNAYQSAGQADLALAEYDMELALGEDNRVLRTWRGHIHLAQGRLDMAQADFEKARELAGSFDPEVEFSLALLREAKGDAGAVEASLNAVLEQATREPVSPYLVALFHFALGRNDEGFELLERAYAERDREILSMKMDYHLASVRSDPRYTNLLRRVGLSD
jgi:tetratricopeptide (TPR) repeat protein